jgi:hypothetical protein
MNKQQIQRRIKKKIQELCTADGFVRVRNEWQKTTGEVTQVVSLGWQNKHTFLLKKPVSTCFFIELGHHYSFMSIYVPNIVACQMRTLSQKSIQQPWIDWKDIWAVAENGEDIEEILSDIERSWREYAQPWFKTYLDFENTLHAFQFAASESREGSTLGMIPCPGRAEKTALMAIHLGKTKLAVDSIEYLLSHKYKEKVLTLDQEIFFKEYIVKHS